MRRVTTSHCSTGSSSYCSMASTFDEGFLTVWVRVVMQDNAELKAS